MTQNTFQWDTADGWKLYADAWEPDGPAKGVVCIVHGLGEHSGRYAHVRKHLAGLGLATWAFDQRGHGKSSGGRGVTPGLERMLEDIDRLLDAARKAHPSLPCFLYGHSMGGILVLNYAMRRKPELAGVIATSPALGMAFEPPAWKVVIGRLADRLAPGMVMANGLELAALSRDPAVVEAYTSDPLVHDRLSARLGVVLMDSGAWAMAHASEFPSRLPLLLVHGSADRLTSADASTEFARLVTAEGVRCTLKIWEGLYHETHNEPEKDQVLAFLSDWLQAQLNTHQP